MSALRNLAGKVRRLPEGIAELWRRFWEGDRQSTIEDLRHERAMLRDYIARLQERDRYMSAEIRRHEASRFLGVGS